MIAMLAATDFRVAENLEVEEEAWFM